MKQVPDFTINNYFRLADLAAISFIQEKDRAKILDQRLKDHNRKYSSVLELPAGKKAPNVLAVPAHLTAAIVEGIVLAPLFEYYFRGMIVNPTMLKVASYCPIVIIFGISLMIGKIFSEFSWKQDVIDPRKAHFNIWVLLKGLLFSLAYLLFLYKLTEIAKTLLEEQKNIALVIFCVGVAELFLGYFAVFGWEIIYAHWVSRAVRKSYKRCTSAIYRHSHECDQNYNYYQHSLKYNAQFEGIQLPLRANTRIDLALAYCKSQDESPHFELTMEDFEVKSKV